MNPKRKIAVILGTGAENLGKLGFEVGKSYDRRVKYSVLGQPVVGHVKVYDAKVSGVPVCLLSRHDSNDDIYTPAYYIDHRSNAYYLVNVDEPASFVSRCLRVLTGRNETYGADIIFASSLVGGCRTTDWNVGDIVAVRDCINEHPDTHYVDGIQPYFHAHNMFDSEVTDMMLQSAKRVGVPVRDGGIYVSTPPTTGAKFETGAEMQKILAPVYEQMQIDILHAIADKSHRCAPDTIDPQLDELFKAFDVCRKRVDSKLFPNLVGMTLAREACWVRTLSGGRTKFVGAAVISDFPEDEKTDHGKNVDVALQRLPDVMRIYADLIPRLYEGA
jgi:purine nucleoside phosphorylase